MSTSPRTRFACGRCDCIAQYPDPAPSKVWHRCIPSRTRRSSTPVSPSLLDRDTDQEREDRFTAHYLRPQEKQ